MIARATTILAMLLGLVGLRSSFEAYHRWQAELAIGDLSAAEVYEVEFWPTVTVSVLLLSLGGFVAGLTSRRRTS